MSLFDFEAQDTQRRNLLFVRKHEPTKDGTLQTKSQQTVVIPPKTGGKISQADINTPKLPSQFGNSFLPVGFLSNPNVDNAIAPTVNSPISTTSSGFNGITQSINSLIASVNKHTSLLTRSIQTDLQRQTNALTGLIKASAEKKINSVLSDVLSGFQGERNDKTIPVTNSLSNTNIQPINNRQQNVNQNGNIGRRTPLVLRNSNALIQQSTAGRSPPRQESFRPLVVSRQPALPASRPLVLAPRSFLSNQRNTDTRSRTRPVMDTTITRTRIPSNPSRQRSETRMQQLQLRRQPTVTRNRLPQVQVTRQQIARGRNTSTQRQRAQTRPVTRQMVQMQQSRRCPSQDDCRPIVPASCRRTSFITDDNGRRLCRGCDEDRCEFAGFEQRWGHGFG
ncbi:unnamed protein product [Mytilus coruscus]|uniref:Uncharacterized protein n=1 Tax=Mytilus coruscus TaxID=42192 RepID=A0A6J8CA59_MYTCO|nr:unnamed protein product [Mytilus coruscus]